MGELKEKAITKLITAVDVNMNAIAVTDLYDIPVGKTCIVTHVVIRNCSGDLTTAVLGFGFDAGGVDCIAAATRTYLDDGTKYGVLKAADGAVRGVGGGKFRCGVTTDQGAAMTIDVDVFGYLF